MIKFIIGGCFLLPFIFCISCDSKTEAKESKSVIESNAVPAPQAEVSAGQKMFYSNCQACHLFNKDLVAPPLNHVAEKWASKKDLYDYMRDPMKYINARKDQRILKLHEQYKIIMPPYSFLKDAEFDSILRYVDMHDDNPKVE